MILRARLVVPIRRRPIVNGAIEIRRDRILRVGPWRDFEKTNSRPVTDLGDVALLPGLINAHCHLDYTDLAGEFLSPRHFSDWLKLIVTAKSLTSNTDFARSWKHGAQMLLRTGTTTVADIEALPSLLPRMWQATPLRVISFLELTGVNSRRAPRDIIARARKKIRRLPVNARWRTGLSPHAPYSTTPELLRLAAQTARRHRWLVTTHVAESTDELEMFAHARGRMFDWLNRQRDCSDCGQGSPVQALARAGMLGRNFLAVHANCLTPADVRLLARNQASVVHCPRSHGFFSHPPFPFAELAAAGVNVCLGTDSLASIEARRKQPPELDMFAEMRAFALKHPGTSADAILRMATVNSAQALGLKGRVGELTPGAFADIIAVPCDQKPAGLHDALLNHSGKVAASMIGGHWAVAPR